MDDDTYLDEEPGSDEGEAAVLAIEAVVVGVEGEMVKVEEPAGRTDHMISLEGLQADKRHSQ